MLPTLISNVEIIQQKEKSRVAGQALMSLSQSFSQAGPPLALSTLCPWLSVDFWHSLIRLTSAPFQGSALYPRLSPYTQTLIRGANTQSAAPTPRRGYLQSSTVSSRAQSRNPLP